MACPITITKFVGTISLGLLTGTSYTLTNILPSLALLPSASLAARTLTTIQKQSTRQILTLASISSLSLLTAYTLAPARGKHPYLLWTALVSFIGGQGVEYWFNGLSRFPSVGTNRSGRRPGEAANLRRGDSPTTSSDSGYIEIEPLGQSDDQVNGEKVEQEMSRERRVQKVRSWIAGLGFAMGVVGIWGDGA